MPIIYLKNPRSGSNFRTIGGPRLPWEPRKKGIAWKSPMRWASCSNPFKKPFPDRLTQAGSSLPRVTLQLRARSPYYAAFLYTFFPKFFSDTGFAPRNLTALRGRRRSASFTTYPKPCK